jgi:hypothetical protein
MSNALGFRGEPEARPPASPGHVAPTTSAR